VTENKDTWEDAKLIVSYRLRNGYITFM